MYTQHMHAENKEAKNEISQSFIMIIHKQEAERMDRSERKWMKWLVRAYMFMYIYCLVAQQKSDCVACVYKYASTLDSTRIIMKCTDKIGIMCDGKRGSVCTGIGGVDGMHTRNTPYSAH